MKKAKINLKLLSVPKSIEISLSPDSTVKELKTLVLKAIKKEKKVKLHKEPTIYELKLMSNNKELTGNLSDCLKENTKTKSPTIINIDADFTENFLFSEKKLEGASSFLSDRDKFKPESLRLKVREGDLKFIQAALGALSRMKYPLESINNLEQFYAKESKVTNEQWNKLNSKRNETSNVSNPNLFSKKTGGGDDDRKEFSNEFPMDPSV